MPQTANPALASRLPSTCLVAAVAEIGKLVAALHAMSSNGHSDWRACWGILWRSLVFMPYMFAVFVGVGSVWLSRWILPVLIALSVYSRDWLVAGCAFALWLLAAWSYRRFRLSRFCESPPSLL
jgi:hypothetical protein